MSWYPGFIYSSNFLIFKYFEGFVYSVHFAFFDNFKVFEVSEYIELNDKISAQISIKLSLKTWNLNHWCLQQKYLKSLIEQWTIWSIQMKYLKSSIEVFEVFNWSIWSLQLNYLKSKYLKSSIVLHSWG